MSYGFYTTMEFLLPNGGTDIIEDIEFEVEVDGFTPGVPASFRGNPDNWSDSESAEVDYTIRLDGREVTLAEFQALGGDRDELEDSLVEAESSRRCRD